MKSGSAKELRYDGRPELGATEKVLSFVLTGGAFAVLSTWTYKRNRKENDEEQIRIKEEVERLEKLKTEYLEAEDYDDSIADEDIYRDLSKRLEESEGGGTKDADSQNQDGRSEDKSIGVAVDSTASTSKKEVRGRSIYEDNSFLAAFIQFLVEFLFYFLPF